MYIISVWTTSELVPHTLNAYTDFSRFTASFASFAILSNDEGTRSFLALEIGAGHAEVSDQSRADRRLIL